MARRPGTVSDLDVEEGGTTVTLWPGSRPDADHARGHQFGRYILLHELGRGGMGIVYAAYDPELDRRVALKVLRTQSDYDDERSRARLQREAQVLAKISHPNVITVHDVGHIGTQLFIAMELIEGADLKAWLAEAERPWAETLDVLIKAGRGLAAAHKVGLIHRDFKPGNVLVAEDGRVQVVDFGLARRFGASEPPSDSGGTDEVEISNSSIDAPLTRTGALAGTPAYMSPEQHARGDLSALTDQFSFCVTAYEALYGRRPFGANTRTALMYQATSGDFEPPPRNAPVPTFIGRAITRGLSPKVADRFPDMDALLLALATDPARRRRRAVTGLLAVGAGVAGLWVITDEPTVCTGAAELLADTWNDGRKAEIRDAFGTSPRPYAKQTLAHVVERLDAYAGSWVAARTDACEATRVRGDQSEDLLDRRIACLDRHAQELGTVVAVFEDADDAVIEHANDALDVLGPIERCANVQAITADVAPPHGPQERAAVEAIRELLLQAQAHRVAGKFGDALRVSEQALVRAQSLDYAPVLAEALLAVGSLKDEAGDVDAAIDMVHEAARVGVAAGAHETTIEAWMTVSWYEAQTRNNGDGALRFVEYARALLERVGPIADIESDLHRSEAAVWIYRGDYERALASSEAALSVDTRAQLPSPISGILQRGNIQLGLARYEDARTTFESGVALAAEQLGALHPTTGMFHNALGNVAIHAGELAEAERQYQSANEIMVATYGPDHPDILYSLGNLGEIRRMRGHYDAALTTARRVLALVEKNFPAVHREVGTTKHNIATILLDKGDPAAAIPVYGEALDVRVAVHGAEHAYVANTLTGRGRALLELDRVAEAVADLERAHTIRAAQAEGDPRKRAATAFTLAHALARAGGADDRARALAEQARDAVASSDDELALKLRGEIEAWLER